MKSIMQSKKECYVSRLKHDMEIVTNLHEHHIFFGNPWRKLSEKYGLKVWLCYNYHEGTCGVHGKNGHELDLELKQLAQAKFEDTHTRDEFMSIFHKNYL